MLFMTYRKSPIGQARLRSGHMHSNYLHFVLPFNLQCVHGLLTASLLRIPFSLFVSFFFLLKCRISTFFLFADVFAPFLLLRCDFFLNPRLVFFCRLVFLLRSAGGIDCVGHWNNGSCSSSCGMGTLTQTFQEDTPPRNGGICEASDGQTRSVGCDGLPSCRMLPVLLHHQLGSMLSVPRYSWPAPCLSTWLCLHLLRFQLIHLNPSVPPPLPQGLC